MKKEKNELFELAASFATYTRANIFLTGRAGTGKTTFLKHIQDAANKKTAVVAPTGIAALNAGGMTIHSFFQMPLGTFVPDTLLGFNTSTVPVNDKHTLLKHARYNAARKTLIQELELLIIDEVSMLRADILDAIDTLLRFVRKQPVTPFGGVQVLFIGDLFQLPPVVKQEEWSLLSRYYKSPFFFEAHVLKENPPVFIELQKIYRQSDQGFIDLLNAVRNNCITEKQLSLLHERYDPDFQPGHNKEEPWITLTTHNQRADAINQSALKALPGRSYSLEGSVYGDFGDRQLPAERTLQLKIGAQVMFIRNDTGEERRYFNGKIGEVVSIDEDEDIVYVKCPGEKMAVEVERGKWQNIRYSYNEKENSIDEEELGSYSQYPLRLAWAVTIHKSQGLTFERAIVDAGASFAAGQVYVALSRLTTLQGLVLQTRIPRNNILTDTQVQAFSALQADKDELKITLRFEQAAFVEQSAIEAFSLSAIMDKLEDNHTSYGEKKIASLEEAVTWSSEMLVSMKEIFTVSEKFVAQLRNILAINNGNYVLLHERVKAASVYFLNKLDSEIIKEIEDHISLYKVKKRTKKYISEMQSLLQYIVHKKNKISQVVFWVEGLANGSDMEQTLRDSRKIIATTTGEIPVKEDTKTISYNLYKAGHSLAEIAKRRGMTDGTIAGHLIAHISTGEIPIEYFVEGEKLTAITEAINSMGNDSIGTIRSKLGENYNYGEIKAVMAFLEKDTVKPLPSRGPIIKKEYDKV